MNYRDSWSGTTDCTGAAIEVKGAVGIVWVRTGVETTGLIGIIVKVGGLITLWTGAIGLADNVVYTGLGGTAKREVADTVV